jgi:hypothetical protein
MNKKEIGMWVLLGLLTVSNVCLHLDDRKDDARLKRAVQMKARVSQTYNNRGHEARQERSRPERGTPWRRERDTPEE